MQPIILFLDSRTMGGIESHVLNLAKALQRNHWPVRVLFWQNYASSKLNTSSQHHRSSELHKSSKHHEEQHPLWQALKKNDISTGSVNGSIRRLLKEIPPKALVHSHGYKANLINKTWSLLGGWQALPTHHNGDLGSGMLRHYVCCDEFSSRWFQPISVSREIYQRLNGKGLLIPNFVDLPKPPESSLHWQIAYVGRISPEKNPTAFCLLSEYLSRDLKKMKQQLHLYGDGSQKETLEHKYIHVSFHGQKAMQEYWHKIGLLCITSLDEGLPLAALEAMSQGIPVCSFAVGDLSQLIREGENGWLIPKGDLDLMAQRVRQWWQMSEEEKKKMQQRAINTIKENYSDEAVLPEILQHYRYHNSRYHSAA